MSSQATVCHSHFKRRRGDFQDVSYTAGLRQLLRLYRQQCRIGLYITTSIGPRNLGLLLFELNELDFYHSYFVPLPCSYMFTLYGLTDTPLKGTQHAGLKDYLNGIADASISSRNSPRGLLLMDCKLLPFWQSFNLSPQKRPSPFFFLCPTKIPSLECIIMKYQQCQMPSTTLLYILQD